MLKASASESFVSEPSAIESAPKVPSFLFCNRVLSTTSCLSPLSAYPWPHDIHKAMIQIRTLPENAAGVVQSQPCGKLGGQEGPYDGQLSTVRAAARHDG
jgi:hypothetical protein